MLHIEGFDLENFDSAPIEVTEWRARHPNSDFAAGWALTCLACKRKVGEYPKETELTVAAMRHTKECPNRH